jgi:DNA-binding Lrp family transcriptional regulator
LKQSIKEENMKLTKNEKKVLKILLKNARVSDSTISKDLKISSQAIGKIRRKLEKEVIENYTANLNYSKLGIRTFAASLAKLTQTGLDKGELDIEKKLLSHSEIIQVFRLPSGKYTHLIIYGFQDMDELDNFFHSEQKKKELHNFLENEELFTFSHNSLIKNDPLNLFIKTIESLGAETKKTSFKEIENFKKNL